MEMRISNTGYFGPGNPIMRRGLSGLSGLSAGSVTDEIFGGGTDLYSTPPYVPADPSPWYTDPKVITGINSEALFAANLYRGLTNQTPLQASQYAPQVAVGLNAQTSQLLMVAAVGLGAVLLMKGRRRGKRR